MKIDGLANQQIVQQKSGAVSNEGASGFSDMLEGFVGDINNDLRNANVAEDKLMAGEVKNLEELMYQIEKSDISLRLITEIRNKTLESYQEIMRMQV